MRLDGDQVVFKAEIGALSRQVGHIQGVWVHPAAGARAWDRRHGLRSTPAGGHGRVASLYVNGFNTLARRAYARIGFEQVASFATVLF